MIVENPCRGKGFLLLYASLREGGGPLAVVGAREVIVTHSPPRRYRLACGSTSTPPSQRGHYHEMHQIVHERLLTKKGFIDIIMMKYYCAPMFDFSE